MGDEERYPTPVETQPDLPPYFGQNRPASPRDNEALSQVSIYLQHWPPSSRNDETLSQASINLHDLQKPPPPLPPARRKCFGLPRPIFFFVIAVMFLVITVAIVVGVVIGLRLKSKSIARLPAITVSGVFAGENNTDWNMQLCYTNRTTSKLGLRFNTGSAGWGAEQSLNLSITPESDSPMAATSMLGNDGNVYLNLFYVKNAAIILANFTCVSTACTRVSNEAITKFATYSLSSDTSLAAVYVGPRQGYRVFYHNTDHYIVQLTSPGDGTWDRGQTISGKALAGSSIAAASIGTGGDIDVLYVDSSTQVLVNVQWEGNTWWSRKS